MNIVESFMQGMHEARWTIPAIALFMEKGFVLEESSNSLGIIVHWVPDKINKKQIEVHYCLKEGPLKKISFDIDDFGNGRTDLKYIVYETVRTYDMYKEGDEIELLERYIEFKADPFSRYNLNQ